MAIIEQLNEGIKKAIKERDQIRLETLRMLKSKILAADARAAIPDDQVIKLFKTYHGNLKEAADQAHGVNRPEIAAKLQIEMKIVEEFLPRTLSTEETRKVVLEAIAESGAKTKKEFGLVMKTISSRKLPIDGKLAKDLAMEQLGE